jgi:hypothetical protein
VVRSKALNRAKPDRMIAIVTRLSLALLVSLGLCSFMPAETPVVVSDAQAAQYIAQNVSVEGVVVVASTSHKGNTGEQQTATVHQDTDMLSAVEVRKPMDCILETLRYGKDQIVKSSPVSLHAPKE